MGKLKKAVALLLLSATVMLWGKDPQFQIPYLNKAPVLDGVFSPGEWDNATALSMFGFYNKKGNFNAEQPIFYCGWDDKYLYVAMDCRENGSNNVVARTSRHDFGSIIGDDCAEIMFAAGYGKQLLDKDFPTYYFALNHLGTVWDAKFKPQRNECHNTWQSGIETVSKTEGSRWIFESRIPIRSISLDPVKRGTIWRSNFCRTFYHYQWVALNPIGALNDARIGADMTFAGAEEPVARVISVESLNAGVHRVDIELVNPSRKPVKLVAEFTAECRDIDGAKEFLKLEKKETVILKPGERRGLNLGTGKKMNWVNDLNLKITDESGKTILEIPRRVVLPVLRLERKIAPVTPAVNVNTVYYHSFDKLEIGFDIRKWLERIGIDRGTFEAQIKITADDQTIAADQKFDAFNTGEGVWTFATKDLKEGHYKIEIVISSKGKNIQKVNDWFEKRNFAWMKKTAPTGVPAPYEALKVEERKLSLWGRTYEFAENGLPKHLITQRCDYIAGEPEFLLTRNGKEIKLEVSKSFRFTQITPRKVTGRAVLKGGGLTFEVVTETEYDGFIRYQVTCKGSFWNKELDRLRIKVPLNNRYAKFLSAAGDTSGVNVAAKVLEQGDGRIYDSMTDTRCVVMTPSFSTLFWLGDHNISFCYAADSDKGWILRADKPAVEAFRKGNIIDLFINLIDKPAVLETAQTMEFGFQTGPTKPRPAEWREFQDVTNNPVGAPGAPKYRVQIGGDGFTTHGGSHSLHPGTTPALQQQSREKIEKLQQRAKPGQVHVVGYQYWGHTVKGFPEARVFRSEWGISADAWESSGRFDSAKWSKKTYGENRDNYYFIGLTPTPSYVDFLTHAYDETLKVTNLYGFYDDVGYPKPVFLPKFGLGYVKDGVEHYSSGLWLYRKRWQAAAEVNAEHNRLNLLSDSQHIHGHFMPAYAFIGVYAPCEHGFYNPFPEKDAFEYFGSLDSYAAITPAKQTGQIPLIGLQSERKDYEGFVQDTRSMFMLTALNDHSLGCFGRREQFTIDRLSAARALFRQWEGDVTFTGYWESGKLCRISDPKIALSAYTRKGQALLMFGNTGDKSASFKAAPDFAALGVDPAKVVLIDAESQKEIPFDGKEFSITLPKHDIAMVLVGAKGSFKLHKRLDWDSFLGKGSDLKFTSHFPTGANGTGKLYGRTYLYGHTWGYGQISTKWNPSATETQLLLGELSFAGLAWNGKDLFQAERRFGRMVYRINNGKKYYGKNQLPKESEAGWFPFQFNAVKICLEKSRIRIFISTDAKTWVEDAVIDRPAELSAAPSELILGWGQDGKDPMRRNLQKYYNPSPRYPTVVYFGNISIK